MTFSHTTPLRRKRFAALTACFALALPAFFSCSSQQDKQPANSITIKMDTLSVADSIVDINDTKIIASSHVIVPSLPNADKDSTARLQNLFCRHMLHFSATNTSDFKETLTQYNQSIIDSYRIPEQNKEISNYLQDENTEIKVLRIEQEVQPIFHSGDLLCMSNEINTFKDGKLTMTFCKYYTFDLKSLTTVTVGDIFKEASIPHINALLKEQLLKDTECSNAEQLIELGYFNIDFLAVTNNFTIDTDGISFHYEPYEIATYALGKITIKLPYNVITDYIQETSPIINFIN